MVLTGFILYYTSHDFGVKYGWGFCAYLCGCIYVVIVFVFVQADICVFWAAHHILSNDCSTKSLNCCSRSLFWVALFETEEDTETRINCKIA